VSGCSFLHSFYAVSLDFELGPPADVVTTMLPNIADQVVRLYFGLPFLSRGSDSF
jgi:hypothetical protein